ncbi:MAG TPA: hypothetical protein VGJ47_01785, partial [Gemmatimonadaceae bacterium]
QDPLRPLTPRPTMAVETEAVPLVPRTIAPEETDPAIDWVPPTNPSCTDPQCNLHYVWLDPSRPSNGKLFVFLPGFTAQSPRPRGHQLVPQEAARLGYHVIALMYQNNVGPGGCAGSPDPDCFENVRVEIIDGIDRSPLVNVSGANSIDNRLTKLLLYLDAQFPAEGWSQFLHQGEPKWSQIAIGGHSGGAAQAALIGKIRHVDRVVMFSGPANESAPWVAIGETPAAKYFELDHVRDHVASVIFANVAALDMERFGAPVQVEFSEPPYEGTHILLTDLEPRGGYATPNPHFSTAVDRWTPLDPDGTPLLRDAWRYILGDDQTDVADVASTLVQQLNR